jgi:ribonuclease BN (tRNA processing enzyme)
VGVKTLVLSHLTPAIDSITDDASRAPAAKYFKGEIIVGKDLMCATSGLVHRSEQPL